MSDLQALLEEIEVFLAIPGIGITATRLGIEALNDSKFVSDLRTGERKRIWPETAAKVRNWMREEKRQRILALGGRVDDEPGERAA